MATRMTTQLGKAQYAWSVDRRGTAEMLDADQGDCDYIGWSVLLKKNGRYFVEARRVGGAQVRLPYQEFESLDAAMQFCMEYDAKRQQNFRKAEAIDL